MYNAAVYCRLSDEDKNKNDKSDLSESLKNQKSLLLCYCQEQGYHVEGVYCDDDFSGANVCRPAFRQMIEKCKAGKVNLVLCKTQSRFSRDMETVEHYIHNLFPLWGVRFVGLLDHADTLDTANKKTRQINGLVNEWYLEDLSDNVRKTLRHKKQNGIFTGAFAPFGYRKDPEVRGHLIPDRKAADVVRRIFTQSGNGAGYGAIANGLNRDGIPAPAAYKQLCGSRYSCRGEEVAPHWTQSAVRSVLKNPVYIGTLVQGKTQTVSYKNKTRVAVAPQKHIVVPNCHEPLVSEQLWNTVNNRGGGRSQKDSGRVHMFSGLVFCGVCGSRMQKMSYRLKHGRYHYLVCKNARLHLCSNQKSIRLDALEKLVYQQVKSYFRSHQDLLKDPCFAETVLAQMFPAEDLSRKKQDILRKMDILYEDKLNGFLSKERFLALYQNLQDGFCVVQREEEAYVTQKAQGYRLLENLPNGAFSLSRGVLMKLFSKIEIGAEQNGTRDITLQFL